MPALCVIEGDVIGKEFIPAAVEVLKVVLPDLHIRKARAGWQTFQEQGCADAAGRSAPECGLELT